MAWSSLSKILISTTSGTLSTWNNNVLRTMSSLWPKLSNLSKPGGLGRLFDFTSFSARPVLVLGHPFFTPRVFLIRYQLVESSWYHAKHKHCVTISSKCLPPHRSHLKLDLTKAGLQTYTCSKTHVSPSHNSCTC